MTVRAPEWKKSSKNCPRRGVSLKGPPKSRSFSSARRRWRFFFLLLASITRLDSVTTSLNFRPPQPFHTRIFSAEESPAIPLHLLSSKGCHNADIERTGVLNNALSFGIDAGRSGFTVDQIHHKTRGRTRSAYEKFQNSCEFSLLPFILAGESSAIFFGKSKKQTPTKPSRL